MLIQGEPEHNVISGCQENDRRSQALLYKHFATRMYPICLSYAADRPGAQDILQEAFIKVFTNIGDYKNNGSLEGWIRRIVTNTAIDHYRKNRRTVNLISCDTHEPDLHVLNPAIKTMGFNELLEQVERLPDGARMIFNLHALDGYSHKEIAKELNITEGTSKSQFNRARKLLINFIGKAGL
jgi:RNA polymerase sigma factor (sigma-70 family)